MKFATKVGFHRLILLYDKSLKATIKTLTHQKNVFHFLKHAPIWDLKSNIFRTKVQLKTWRTLWCNSPLKRPFGFAQKELAGFCMRLREQLAQGIIRRSATLCGAQVLFTALKIEALSICINHNASYILPIRSSNQFSRFDRFLYDLPVAEYFPTKDLESWNYQIWVQQDSIWLPESNTG